MIKKLSCAFAVLCVSSFSFAANDMTEEAGVTESSVSLNWEQVESVNSDAPFLSLERRVAFLRALLSHTEGNSTTQNNVSDLNSFLSLYTSFYLEELTALDPVFSFRYPLSNPCLCFNDGCYHYLCETPRGQAIWPGLFGCVTSSITLTTTGATGLLTSQPLASTLAPILSPISLGLLISAAWCAGAYFQEAPEEGAQIRRSIRNALGRLQDFSADQQEEFKKLVRQLRSNSVRINANLEQALREFGLFDTTAQS